MKLLDNAVQSIKIGLEDFDDPKKLISATRNIYAGVLLVFKEKLRRLSPADSNEVLVKKNIVPKIKMEILYLKALEKTQLMWL